MVFFYTLYPLDFYLFDFDFHDANLVPLVETIRFLRYLDAPGVKRNLVGNILLLAPLGFLLPILFRRFRQFLQVTAAGLLVTLSIEAVQLTMAYRVFDIDDVILNLLGVLFGYILFAMFRVIPFIRRLVDQITDFPRTRTRNYSAVYAVSMIVVGLGVASMSFLANTKTEGESVLDVTTKGAQPVAQSVSGKYLTVLYQEPAGTLTAQYYRQTMFGRYALVFEVDGIVLPPETFMVTGRWSVGKYQDEFVVVRSNEALAFMVSGREQFQVDPQGSYYFSIGRFRIEGFNGNAAFNFIDDKHNAVDLNQIQ